MSSDYGNSLTLNPLMIMLIFLNLASKFTYDWDFRQSSSTSITDSIGGLTATYNGGMSSTVSDGAIFDGTNDYMKLDNFSFGTTFSLEFYYKQESTTGVTVFLEASSPSYAVNTVSNSSLTDILRFQAGSSYYNAFKNNGTNTAIWGDNTMGSGNKLDSRCFSI